MTKKVLVTGASGQLGRAIAKYAENYIGLDFTFVTRNELDLSVLESIAIYFDDKSFDVVINCAAYTAVDQAESEPELAEIINCLAVKEIGNICKEKNIALIHISTDYVFSGHGYKPYIETDITEPQNVYGKTKLKAEHALREINPIGMILRTSWLYSEFGRNFVSTMLSIGKENAEVSVVGDQIGTPTYAGDLANVILEIIAFYDLKNRNIRSNIFHFSNLGVASWYDFAKAIFEIGDIQCRVKLIETESYKTAAVRPYYSVFNNSKVTKEYAVKNAYWKESLEVCMRNIQI